MVALLVMLGVLVALWLFLRFTDDPATGYAAALTFWFACVTAGYHYGLLKEWFG